MIALIIILLLFSISLCSEIVNLDFTLELRSLIFAVLICSLIMWSELLVPMNRDSRKYRQIKNLYIFGNWWSNGVLVKSKFKFISIDIAYFATVCLTVISFVTKAQNINAFHYVFVVVGMAVVYFVIRAANSYKILLQSKIIYSVVGIGFIVVVIGLIQFVMGKPLVSTFGRTSYLGCFMAMNVPLAFSLVLATTESKGLSKVKGRKVEGEKEIPLAPFMKGGIIITKDQIRYLS